MDKSKWAHVELAKPIDPHLVIEAARAIRANPEIWAIFTTVKPDEWISRDDSTRIGMFVQAYFESTGRSNVISVNGMDKHLLRRFLSGDPSSLDDDDKLLAWLKANFGSQVVGGE